MCILSYRIYRITVKIKPVKPFFTYHIDIFILRLFSFADALNNFDDGKRQVDGSLGTAGIWSTYPQVYVSTWNCFGDQVKFSEYFTCVLQNVHYKNGKYTLNNIKKYRGNINTYRYVCPKNSRPKFLKVLLNTINHYATLLSQKPQTNFSSKQMLVFY
jgi:hypothetical protein